MRATARIVPAACVVLALLASAGCGNRLQRTLGLPNQSPEVRLTSTLLSSPDDASVSHRLSWTASDPDGRVDRCLIAEDPAGDDPAAGGWAATVERTRVLSFRRVPLGAAAPADRPARDFRVFAVRAVDDRGALSVPVKRAFFGDDVAPSVRITSPVPSPLYSPYVPPNPVIRWQGSDPDGRHGLPEKYKFRLFRLGPDYPFDVWFRDPDSLRRTFAPTFPGWDSVNWKTTEVQLANLEPQQEYLFVITAIDDQGAYDPLFTQSTNMLRMRVADPAAIGPLITLFQPGFNYTYASGGYNTDPSRAVRTAVLAGSPVTVNWFATPLPGSTITGYRWTLDIVSPDDSTRRHGPHDLSHWSAWSMDASVSVGPFAGDAGSVPEIHQLYVEARDSNGFISLGWLVIEVVRPTFARDLLIVDDTRLAPDWRVSRPPASSPDSLQAPHGSWPSAAELDTFLYAVGGVRWRMTPNGTLSPSGVFKGYRFDTLGTRRGLGDPTVPLALLGQYRHIIWYVDGASSMYEMTALGYMSAPNHVNTLGAWVAAGGKLWAMGGGFGNATNGPWNNPVNDLLGRIYTSQGTRPDLVAGRFMYDLTHWRSAFAVKLGIPGVRIERSPFPIGGWDGAPSYALLPAWLRPRSPATDPLPPLRGSSFYTQSVDLEYLSLPNEILEAKNPSPRHQHDIQALDTLCVASGALLPEPGPDPAVDRFVNPCMTYYHGVDNGPVVFSGFGIWSFARPDCERLVDAVLQGIWGLSRESGTTASGVRQARRQPPQPPGPVSVRTRR
ncbi:MAG: hypothetical protein HZC42_09345 [Candidatus Eisenbacteria bacterium]|nr:hypothetical protein [Candidatus Eisenbacteria bacterium]